MQLVTPKSTLEFLLITIEMIVSFTSIIFSFQGVSSRNHFLAAMLDMSSPIAYKSGLL